MRAKTLTALAVACSTFLTTGAPAQIASFEIGTLTCGLSASGADAPKAESQLGGVTCIFKPRKALARAQARGVAVRSILDKTNEKYTGVTDLRGHGVNVLIDDKVKIAHNKVIVIDRQHVITGSFNFTPSAQTARAEDAEGVQRNAARVILEYAACCEDEDIHG